MQNFCNINQHSGSTNVSAGTIDWERIRENDSLRQKFNERLNELNNSELTHYSTFMENIMRAGADTAMRIKTPTKGWFGGNREDLQPKIQAKNRLLNEMRKAEGEEKDSLKKKLREASEEVSHRIAIAKANWSRKKAEHIHSICMLE